MIGVIDQKVAPTGWRISNKPPAFVLRDHNGQALGYFYYEEEPGRQRAAKLLASR